MRETPAPFPLRPSLHGERLLMKFRDDRKRWRFISLICRMTLKLADAASGRGRVDSEPRSSPYSPLSRLAATRRLWLARYYMGRYDSRDAAYRNP